MLEISLEVKFVIFIKNYYFICFTTFSIKVGCNQHMCIAHKALDLKCKQGCPKFHSPVKFAPKTLVTEAFNMIISFNTILSEKIAKMNEEIAFTYQIIISQV